MELHLGTESGEPKVNAAGIPSVLRARKQWVCWKLEYRKDSKKPTKIPYQPGGSYAKTNAPVTWHSFQQCQAALVDKYDGLGYCFSDSDGLTGIDLDHCFDQEKNLLSWAREIVDALDGTWMEYSPSRDGLHIWVQGKPARSGKGATNKSIEVYSYPSNRYFTVTGNTFSGADIVANQPALDWLHERHMVSGVVPAASSPPADEDEKVRRALEFIPADDYETWLKVGMALKADGHACALWDWWSQKSPKYQAGVCASKWKSFKRTGVGVGSIIHLAENYGLPKPRDNVRDIKSVPARNTERQEEPINWPEPVRLLDALHLPSIDPYRYLPRVLAEMVEQVAYVTQTPIELSVLTSLAVVATCVQGKYRITPGGDWVEVIGFFVVNGAESGERKSAIFRLLTAPIKQWVKEEMKATALERARTNALRDIKLAQLKALRYRHSKISDTDEALRCAEEYAQLELEIPDEVFEPYLFGGETTPEGLQRALSEHYGRWSILTDEGGIFTTLGGVFHKGAALLDTVLQCHSGDPIDVWRQSRHLHIDNPCLTICVMVQPSVIQGLGRRDFRGSGFLARFLYVQPVSNIGSRIASRRASIRKDVAKRYQQALDHLLNWRPEGRIIITLSPQALEAFNAFAQSVEDQCVPGCRLYHIRDWASKLAGQALRLSANICLVSGSSDLSEPVVQLREMEMALDLCEILIEHALYCFSTMSDNEGIADAKFLLEHLVRTGKAEVTYGYLHALDRFRGNNVARLREALDFLQAKYIIAGPIERPSTGKGGRKTTVYKVNPRLFERGKADELASI